MAGRERICFYCEKCEKEGSPHRRFLLPGDPEPRCTRHGRMTREPNRPYFKKRPK